MNETRLFEAQILYSRVAAICAEGAASFQRMSRSSLVSEDGGFASGLLGPDGTLYAQTQGEPSHLYALRDSVRSLLDYFAFDLADGDALVVGDPYFGGTEGNVLTIAVPAFREGELLAVPAIRFAVPDLGGEAPGALQPEAHEIWRESLRVTPLKLHRGSVLQRDALAYLVLNSRTPDVLRSDLRAAIALCTRMGGQLADLAAVKGGSALARAAERMIGHAGERTSRRLAELIRDRVTERANLALSEGTDAEIRVSIQRHSNNGIVDIDFTGSSSTARGPFNLTKQSAKAAASLPLLGELLDDLTINDGIIDAVRFNLPPDSLVNPKFPAAVNLGWRTTAHVVSAAVTRAQHKGAVREQAAPINGAGPAAVLFRTIGAVEDQNPIYLSPGFAPTEGCGGPAIQGARRLHSAEELETSGALRMRHRQLTEDGDMSVSMTLQRDGLEGTFIAPNDAGQSRPQIVIDGRGGKPTNTPGVQTLHEGDQLAFLFPRVDGAPDVEP
ncbi:MAG: hydantoinase B/oxoprolinase family protein [Hyphomicrobiales bacterium]|nr:hydantoinase B/oxoprolinase family protein [Hyphomicrobiales bacterium]